jgi:hypothetical protein
MSEPGTRRLSRRLGRVGAAVVGAAVLTLAFISIDVADDRCDDLSATQCDRVFDDFSSPQLMSSNDGTPLGVYNNGGNTAGLAAVDSQLSHGAPKTPNAAGYLEARMAAPVTRIGAIASFHSVNSGAIGLLSWANSLVAARGKGSPGPAPNGGMHFAASSAEWILSIWDSAANAIDTLLEGPLSLRADGTEYPFEVVREGDTVTVRLPDGTTHSASDPRIGQWSGPWACWELYEAGQTRVPATIEAIWAS